MRVNASAFDSDLGPKRHFWGGTLFLTSEKQGEYMQTQPKIRKI